MRIKNSINWKVGGPAGEGVMTTGLIFSKVCARHGLKIFDYTEYPSLITGGHNTYQVYSHPTAAYSQHKMLDVLVCFDKNSLNLHHDELNRSSLVIFDSQDDAVNIAITDYKFKCSTFDLPMVKLATEAGGNRLMANNVALGASIFLFDLDLELLNGVIRDIFKDKGEEVVNSNIAAAKAGYDFLANNYKKQILKTEKVLNKSLITLTGNEAVGVGAIAGGIQMYVAYPMTPASSVLHVLAAKSKDANVVVKHAEDEIGAINMALGGSFAGARTMTGTSGGGFCYMTEALGLSGVGEIPLVVFESMRPGPALGMPTWTAQGDLQFLLTASQDEFPRFVFTPADATEAFHMTRLALEFSEKYQTVAIVAVDKYISESRFTMELKSTEFKNERHNLDLAPKLDESGFYPRYKSTDSGISLRTVPGQAGGTHICNSYEHDEYGFGTESAEVRVRQVDKRNKKFESMKTELVEQFFIGDSQAKLTLVSFGSTRGPLLSARDLLALENKKINILNLSWFSPFPKTQVSNVIKDSKRVAVVEGNSQGQLGKIIAQETGVVIQDKLLKYDGRPFYPSEIVEFVNSLI